MNAAEDDDGRIICGSDSRQLERISDMICDVLYFRILVVVCEDQRILLLCKFSYLVVKSHRYPLANPVIETGVIQYKTAIKEPFVKKY